MALRGHSYALFEILIDGGWPPLDKADNAGVADETWIYNGIGEKPEQVLSFRSGEPGASVLAERHTRFPRIQMQL